MKKIITLFTFLLLLGVYANDITELLVNSEKQVDVTALLSNTIEQSKDLDDNYKEQLIKNIQNRGKFQASSVFIGEEKLVSIFAMTPQKSNKLKADAYMSLVEGTARNNGLKAFSIQAIESVLPDTFSSKQKRYIANNLNYNFTYEMSPKIKTYHYYSDDDSEFIHMYIIPIESISYDQLTARSVILKKTKGFLSKLALDALEDEKVDDFKMFASLVEKVDPESGYVAIANYITATDDEDNIDVKSCQESSAKVREVFENLPHHIQNMLLDRADIAGQSEDMVAFANIMAKKIKETVGDVDEK